AKSAESPLEIIVRRHQNRSTLMTSNRPIEEWGQHLSDNIDGWENIIAVRAPLWKRSTRLCIHDPGRGNWAYQVFRSKCAVRLRQRVPGVRLESVMEMAGVERVDILKVDIEGAEIEVFETA